MFTVRGFRHSDTHDYINHECEFYRVRKVLADEPELGAKPGDRIIEMHNPTSITPLSVTKKREPLTCSVAYVMNSEGKTIDTVQPGRPI